MKTFVRTAAAAAVATACQFCAAESVAVYQIFDMLGQYRYKIMNKEEFLKESAKIKEEEKVFPAAMAEAKKDWDDNAKRASETKRWDAAKANKQPFPANKLKPRSIKKFSEDFTDPALAKKSLAQAESHAAANPLDTKGTSKKQNATADDTKREQDQARAFTEAVSMVNMRMGTKLGRPVPAYGYTTPEEPNKKIP